MKITSVTNENVHEIIPKYIEEKKIKIENIDDIIETYIKMVEDKYLFIIEGDLLKDILVNITYMYSPNDDANKDRVLCHLTGDSDSDDSEDLEDLDNDSPKHKNQKNASVQTHKEDKKDKDNEQDNDD